VSNVSVIYVDIDVVSTPAAAPAISAALGRSHHHFHAKRDHRGSHAGSRRRRRRIVIDRIGIYRSSFHPLVLLLVFSHFEINYSHCANGTALDCLITFALPGATQPSMLSIRLPLAERN